MQRIPIRRQKQDNQNNKRWSAPFIDNNDQEEQISSQSPYLTLLINKFGIPKEKALVNKYIFSFFFAF
jgi:ATP adenylyltransferase/5',5'''-P-1,P-4-tetraphosphate phosphorylase II